jgi:16S rRNA (cytidine1402-2'-O)-methyltransferase
MPGLLYIVSTPIGNLSDISLRALDTLKQTDMIACEDTRRTKVLLSAHRISKPLVSYFEHNKQKRTRQLLALLRQGKNIALVSDAGTPGISDPGYRLIKDALDNAIEVVAVPGACAAVAGLTLSGMPTDRFIFEGFLPNKAAARKKKLLEFKNENRTVIIYESPHRLLAALRDIRDTIGDIKIACVREATKKFEETLRQSVSSTIEHFEKTKPRGEFVLVFNPGKQK